MNDKFISLGIFVGAALLAVWELYHWIVSIFERRTRMIKAAQNANSSTVLVTKALWDQIMEKRAADEAELEQLRGCSRGRKACDAEIDGLKESLAKTNRKLSDAENKLNFATRCLYLIQQTTLNKKGILNSVKETIEQLEKKS